MKLVLKSVSEDVSVDNPESTKSYLVFDGDGEELRVPVSRESIVAVVTFMNKKGAFQAKQASVQESEDEAEHQEPDAEEVDDEQTHPEEADSFGGEWPDEEVSEEEDEDPIAKFELPRVPKPASEDEVPSL